MVRYDQVIHNSQQFFDRGVPGSFHVRDGRHLELAGDLARVCGGGSVHMIHQQHAGLCEHIGGNCRRQGGHQLLFVEKYIASVGGIVGNDNAVNGPGGCVQRDKCCVDSDLPQTITSGCGKIVISQDTKVSATCAQRGRRRKCRTYESAKDPLLGQNRGLFVSGRIVLYMDDIIHRHHAEAQDVESLVCHY